MFQPLLCQMLLPLNTFLIIARLVPVCPCLSCTGEPRPENSTPDVFHQSWVSHKDDHPQSAGNTFSCSPECCWASLSQHHTVGLLIIVDHQDLQVLFRDVALQPARPKPVMVSREIPSLGQNFMFPLLNLMTSLLAWFSSLSKSLWMAALHLHIPAQIFLVCKYSRQPPAVIFLMTYIWNLSWMHPRSLIHCSCSAVLFLQQRAGWIKSSMWTDACEHEASSSWVKASSPTSS